LIRGWGGIQILLSILVHRKAGLWRQRSSWIALIPHASKIMLRVIQGRLATYIEREISEEQAGLEKAEE